MKVNFKRVATAALAVAMSLSLSVPAFAEGNGGDRNLTVTGDTLDNKNVYAVQMFTARVSADAGSNTFDSYELAQEWMPFFKDTTVAGINLGDQDSDGVVDSDDARAYVEKLEGQNLVDFADKAQAWVRSHDGQPSDKESTDEQKVFANKIITVTANSDIAQFTDLQPGYYLVYPEGGFTGEYEDGTRTTDAMLVNVPRDNDAVLNIKSTFPTVDKKVDTNITEGDTHDDATDNGSAQVGDTVTFTLKSKVPDMTDYDTFYFAFNDTLSNGLKFVEKTPGDSVVDANDVTVTIGGKTVTSGYSASQSGRDLKIVFTDLKNGVTVTDGTVTTGAEIVVTYQAMITEAAVVGTPALNTVKVEYSNDPTTDNKGESTPDTSTVYTYDIDVNKWAAGPDGKKGTEDDIANLAGAKFQLTTDEAGKKVVKLVANGTDAYRVAKPDATQPDGYETGAVDSFLTTDSGDITISGLEGSTEPGTTYYLHEVKAPDGYNKLKDPVEIVITITNMDTGAATITVNDVAASGDGTTVDVENKKGIELPETGSIGTIGLTALGVVVVVAGLFAFPRKKKNRQD